MICVFMIGKTNPLSAVTSGGQHVDISFVTICTCQTHVFFTDLCFIIPVVGFGKMIKTIKISQDWLNL